MKDDINEDVLTEILATRETERITDDENVTDVDVLASAVDDADLEELTKAEATFHASKAYKADLKDHAAKHLAGKPKAKPKAAPKAKGKAKAAAAGPDPPAEPNPDIHAEWTAENMRKFLPPVEDKYSWTMSKDDVNRRWLVSHKLHGSCSRAFELYGEQRGAALTLQYAWAHHAGGTQCPFAWVRRLAAA